MNRFVSLGATLLWAPWLAVAATSQSTVVERPPSASPAAHLAWKADPAASGPLAVHAGDHVVIGRLATFDGGQAVVESDLGGTETVQVGPQTKMLQGAKPQDLHTGDVVSVAYQKAGASRTADALAPGDISAPGR